MEHCLEASAVSSQASTDWKQQLEIVPVTPDHCAEAAVAHIRSSLTLETLIFGWLTPSPWQQTRRRVELYTDDTEATFGRFCILFRERDASLAEASLPADGATQLFSGALVTEAITDPYCPEMREKWMERRDQELSMQYDQRIGGEVVDTRTALALAFSYSLTLGGLSSFELLDGISRECLNEWDDGRELANKPIVWANYHYQENIEEAKKAGKGTAFGWGEDYYLIF